MIKLLQVAAVADRLGVSQKAVRIWTDKGFLRAATITPGGYRRYTEEDIADFERRLHDGSFAK